ncbi:MAG: zinc ribbon domain-containing protein, partial [Candidatus Cloacimonetes bacterium]|nr:zinc ribbon domain-containing protein [Candidatus Cloacimonadota bacterium]
MKCPVCGTPVEDTARYCAQCGRPVQSEQQPDSPETVPAASFDELRVVVTDDQTPTAPLPVASAWSRWWPHTQRIFAILAVLAALLGLFLPFYHVPGVEDALSAPGMVTALLASLDLATTTEDASAVLAAGQSLESITGAAEQTMTRVA